MNKLTREEFQDRIQALQRAQRIFIETGLTENNISLAFAAYQSILAETERPMTMKAGLHGTRVRTFLDGNKRPACPLCGADVLFAPVKDRDPVKSILSCSNVSCDGLWLSGSPFEDWVKALDQGLGPKINLARLPRGSKKEERKNRFKSTPVNVPCPKCGGAGLYELAQCCGAPEGLIECGDCDFQETPSRFNERSK